MLTLQRFDLGEGKRVADKGEVIYYCGMFEVWNRNKYDKKDIGWNENLEVRCKGSERQIRLVLEKGD